MSQISKTIEMVESRIVQLEGAVGQSLANHNALLGQVVEAKSFLDSLRKMADELAPDNVVTAGIDVVDNVVDAIAPQDVNISSTDKKKAY